MKQFDCIIIGAGTAGLTAAVYAQRAGLKTVVLEGGIYGGQITNTPDVENYPAIDKISGFEFAMNMYNQAVKFGTVVEMESVTKVELEGDIKKAYTASEEYCAKTLIIANGAKRRKLGCPGEEELSGKGVSYCATCDGAFFKGKDVVIVGGGNTALEDAIYLASICNKVHVVHRRDEFRASSVIVESLKAQKNIEIHYDSVTESINGENKVESVTLKNVKTNEAETIEVSGVFVAVGLVPDNEMYAPVKLDKTGYIIAGEDCKTNIDGVYAAGDTRTKTLRQLVTAAADGAVAANEAANYIRM